MANNPNIAPSLQTSQIFRIRGQKSLFYPDQALTPEHCVTISNVNFTEQRTVDIKDGSAKYNTNAVTGPKPLNGMYQVTFSNGTTENIEVAGSVIYTNDGTTRSTVTGTAEKTDSETAKVRMVYIDDKVVATDGASRPWTKTVGSDAALWANASGTGVTAPFKASSGDFVRDFVVHRNYLCALHTKESGTLHPTRIRWCDVDTPPDSGLDIFDWPIKHVYDLYENGPPIIGGTDNFGRLLVFKEDGLYPCRLEFLNGLVELVINPAEVRRGFSPVATHSIISRPEFTWVVCRDGAYVVRPDFSVEWVTVDFHNTWVNLDQARIKHAVSYVRERDHQVRTLIQTTSATNYFDQVMVWDWQTGDMWLDEPTDELSYATSYFINNVEFDYHGTGDGYALKANDPSASNDNGTAVTGKVQMAPNDLGYPGRTKRIVNLRSLVKTQDSTNSINVSAIRDQGQKLARTGALSLGTSLTWDQAGLLWDDGTTAWPGGTTESLNLFVNRTCETIAPKWEGDGTVGLVGYQVEYVLEEN
tara:strand:- start:642 stop:2231 length:1590 start_codon:yes stop_codon:yes gene_type:complete